MIRYNVYKPKHSSLHAPGKENNIINYSLPFTNKKKKESVENEDEDESRRFDAEKIAIALK